VDVRRTMIAWIDRNAAAGKLLELRHPILW
jgi:hypothetical protein